MPGLEAGHDASGPCGPPGDMSGDQKRALAQLPRPCHLCSPATHSACGRLGVARIFRAFSTAPKRVSHEGYRRTRRTFEVAGPRASRGRAPQHHSDPRQRAGQGREGQTEHEGDRPRSRGHRLDRRRSVARGLDHRAGAHVLRHRAQAARGRADRDRGLRRPRRAVDPRRPFALHAADAAGERLPRPRRRRHDAFLHAAGRRSQAADRQDAVRDLHRRDALLPQRHLSARGRHRQRPRRCARWRPTGIGWRNANCRCRPAPPACRASSCRARRWARCSG